MVKVKEATAVPLLAAADVWFVGLVAAATWPARQFLRSSIMAAARLLLALL
jgi:hypothetical protein